MTAGACHQQRPSFMAVQGDSDLVAVLGSQHDDGKFAARLLGYTWQVAVRCRQFVPECLPLLSHGYVVDALARTGDGLKPLTIR
jgi:hypothetical protein